MSNDDQSVIPAGPWNTGLANSRYSSTPLLSSHRFSPSDKLIQFLLPLLFLRGSSLLHSTFLEGTIETAGSVRSRSWKESGETDLHLHHEETISLREWTSSFSRGWLCNCWAPSGGNRREECSGSVDTSAVSIKFFFYNRFASLSLSLSVGERADPGSFVARLIVHRRDQGRPPLVKGNLARWTRWGVVILAPRRETETGSLVIAPCCFFFAPFGFISSR